MNPIRGILPGSPLVVQGNTTSHEEEIDKQLETANSEWQKDATKYVREHITPDSRYKLKKFIDDEMLNKIRLDKTLFHIPKSKGSYIDSRTGRLTSSGNKAKERPLAVRHLWIVARKFGSVHQNVLCAVQWLILRIRSTRLLKQQYIVPHAL